MAVLSRPMAVLSRPAMRSCSFINNGKLIKAKLKEDSYAQPPRRLEGLGSLRAPVINVYKEPYKEVKEPL